MYPISDDDLLYPIVIFINFLNRVMMKLNLYKFRASSHNLNPHIVHTIVNRLKITNPHFFLTEIEM